MKRISSVLAVLALASCGIWVGNPKPKDEGGGTGKPASIAANLVKASGGFNLDRGGIASGAAADLVSLKYIIRSIMICEQAKTNGGFDYYDVENCLEIVMNQECDTETTLPCRPTTADVASGKYASEQTDLMNPEDLAKLATRQELKAEHAHAYNWAIMTWEPGIAIKGSVAVGDVTIRTKAGINYSELQPDAAFVPTKTGSDMTAGETEETVVQSANGGAAFRFQTPFVIKPEDIENGVEFTVDLAFDPEALLSASKIDGAGGSIVSTVGPAVSMFMPMVQLLPVPRRSGEATRKETYAVDVAPGRTLRIELFFNGSDSARSVYAAGAMGIAEPDSPDAVYGQIDAYRVTSITANPDGTLKLENNQSGVVVDGLTRGISGTLTAIGEAAEASTKTPTYTFVGETSVP